MASSPTQAPTTSSVSQSNDSYTPLYITLAVLTVFLCFYVTLSFLRSPHKRKPPAPIMLSKTISDLVFALLFFIMLLDEDAGLVDNSNTQRCAVLGPFFALSFIISQSYFTAICWDLWRTLRNPFRPPAADSIKLHIVVWLLGAFLVAIVSPFGRMGGGAVGGIFRYREAYGICFSCNTGRSANVYNFVLFYAPLFVANLAGVVITVYAFRRLANGLEKTFELRQKIIKRQLVLVGCLTALSFITVVSWGVLIYAPSFDQLKPSADCLESTDLCLNPSAHCDAKITFTSAPRILLSFLVFFNGGFDALAWFLLHRLTRDQSRPYKVKKEFLIGGDSRADRASPKQSEFGGAEELNDEKGTNEREKQQNVSNALRGEIIAYMTAGLERSIYNTARETYQQTHAFEAPSAADFEASRIDEDHVEDEWTRGDLDDEQNQGHKLRKGTNGAMSASLRAGAGADWQNMLHCEEKAPPRAKYPINIQHDPATHPGVINEIYVQLETQQIGVYNAMSPQILPHIASKVSSSNNNVTPATDGDAVYGDLVSTQRMTMLRAQAKADAQAEAEAEAVQQTQNQQTKPEMAAHAGDDEKEAVNANEAAMLASLDVKPKAALSITPTVYSQESTDLAPPPPQQQHSTDLALYDSVEMSHVESQDAPAAGADDEPMYAAQHTKSGSAFLGSITRTISRAVETLNTGAGTHHTQESSFNYAEHHGFTDQSLYRQDSDVDDDTADAKGSKKNGIPFKDYAPHCFRYLRQQIYGISDAEYATSVRPPDSAEQSKLVQEKFSEGRSGAFFFFTHDNKYIIKTVTKGEASLLLRILPAFVEHYRRNKHTLINRFFGLHSIAMYNLTIYFVVLENIFVAGAKPHESYDIKGSWVDRHTHHHVESGKLMKDQDLHKTLKVAPEVADAMYRQLKADSKFLATQGIMDYSVLLGIYYVGIHPGDVKADRIMQHHHDAAGGGRSYVAPIIEEKADSLELVDGPHEMQLEASTGPMPADLQTERALEMPEEMRKNSRGRPRAPSYTTGMREFAQKDKAVQARVIEGPGIYYLGIIDVLQEWDTSKKLERLAKVYLRCKSGDGISCVEPVYYRKRFLRKMWRIGLRPFADQSARTPSVM